VILVGRSATRWLPPDLRAVLAAQVALQLMDRRVLGAADDVERDGLMCVAAEAPHFEIAKARVECVTQRR
jgi:hypothetical protein